MRAASNSRGVAKILVRPALWFCTCHVLATVLAAQCSNPTQVPNGTYTSGDHSQVDNNALSAANVVLSGSATATFVAGNCIQLLPGFHASAIGATVPTTFHAWVETAPADVSVSPSSGSGLSQQFTWTVSSPSGYSNLSDVFAIFNTSVSGVNACYIHYNRTSNLLYLADDSGANWLGGFVPGSSVTASNSQCSIYGSGSSFSGSGTQLALTVSVTFQTSFAGTKNNYLIGYDNQGLNTTWQQMGTWTAPIPTELITVTTNPSGLSFLVDSVPYSSPQTFQWVAGSNHTLGLLSPQSGGAGTQYVFANWSDGQGASHTITVPSSSATYTANFTTQYYLTTTASPAAGGTIAPPSGWYNPGTVVSVGATANPGYQFTGFSAPPGGATTPQNLTINAPVTVTAYFQALPAILTITSTHSGDFTQGQAGATYSLTVGNAAGAGPTSGTVMVTEFIPTGLLPVSMSGTGWTCPTTGTTCTRGDALSAGSSYPAITLTMNVASNAPSPLTNQATVSGGGSASAAASDPTTVDALLRYSNPLAFATSASVVAGVPTTLTVTYTSDNGPSDILSGQVMIDNCYLEWDYTGHVILYGANGGGQVNGTLLQNTTLSAGNCSINLASSSLSPLASNLKALVLSLAITFPEQAYPSPDGRTTPPTFVGTHEVYAWGTSFENLTTSRVDLGSLVVSQGQDFTLTLGTSESFVNLGTGATLSLPLSATGLNGFTGSIPVTIISGSSGCFVFMGTPPTSIAANSQTTITVRNNNCSQSAYMNFMVASTPAIGIFHSTSYANISAAPTGDFNIGVSGPYPAVLSPQTGVSYTVTVSPTNGLTGGCVSLSLGPGSLPAGVTYFLPSAVCLNGSGSVTASLTFSASPITPPGTWPLQVTGTLGSSHIAAFSLSTQVTTFQVTSATGSAIVHNTGQEVQTVHSVTAGNVPSNAACAPVPADPNVTCRVVSSSPGTVTIGITAGTGAVHGTRVLSLNGGAAPFHAALADVVGAVGSSLPSIQAGAPPTPATLAVLGVDLGFCDPSGQCGDPEVIVDGPVEADITDYSGDTLSVTFYADASASAGTYGVYVSLCGGYWDPSDDMNTEACVAGPAFLQVTAAPAPPSGTSGLPPLPALPLPNDLLSVPNAPRPPFTNTWDSYLRIQAFSLIANAANAAAAPVPSQYHYPTKLTVDKDSCTIGEATLPTVAAYRSITYQVLDQNGTPWQSAWGPLSVTEIVVSTGGTVETSTPGPNWSTQANPATIDSQGRFTDNLSVGGFVLGPNPPGTANQVFYATGNFTPQPLVVHFYVADWLILSNYYSASTVLVNGIAAPGGCK